MDEPVDLSNLRSITEGDKELEQSFFSQFMESFEENLKTIEVACTENNSAVWRSVSHGLKGTSLSVGAMDLGGLCKVAQENYLLNGPEKQLMLEGIKAEYAKVRVFLLSQM